MKKRMIIMVSALILLFGGIIAFNIIKGIMIKRFLAHMEPPAVTVSSVIATEQDWQPRIAAVGNFVAMDGLNINAQAAGNVVAIHFNSGEFLQKDQPLIDIDDSVEQSTLKFNQAALTLNKINYKRQLDLSQRGAASASSVDEAYAKLLQAEAQVENTQALIRQKHITTPFAGRIGIRKINLGEYITPGKTNIVTLQRMDPLYLEFHLPEHLFAHLKTNQTIEFSVEQYPHVRFQGKITAINAIVDNDTHTFQVQATVPNCPAIALKDPTHFSITHCNSALNQAHEIKHFSFMPGMFASIEVEQPSIAHQVVLPSTAISYTLYGNSVFIIEKDNDILRVKRVFVTTGERRGNNTIIKKGVKAGQVVVASGELKLQNGTRVIVNNDLPLNSVDNSYTLGQ